MEGFRNTGRWSAFLKSSLETDDAEQGCSKRQDERAISFPMCIKGFVIQSP